MLGGNTEKKDGVGFKQQKIQQGGGVKEIQLYEKLKYTVNDVIEAAKKQFMDSSDLANLILQNSCIKLGLYDERFIDDFILPNNTFCGLWNFMQYYKLKQLYLLSTYNEDMSEDALTAIFKTRRNFGVTPEDYKDQLTAEKQMEQHLEYINKENEDRNSTEKNDEDIDINFSIREIEVKSSQDKKESKLPKNDVEGNATLLSLGSKDHGNFVRVQSNLQITPKAKQKNDLDQATKFPPTNLLKTNNTPVLDPSMKVKNKNKENNYNSSVETGVQNEVEVKYLYITSSNYSNELTFGREDRASLFYKLDDEDMCREDLSTFDPSNYGYEIGSISINNKMLVMLEYDGKEKNYYYPDEIADAPFHKILYDIDVVHGYETNEKYSLFGIGIVSNCLSYCKPIFKWYMDEIVYREGPGLFWLQNIPINKVHSWKCEIKCSNGFNATSAEVKFGANLTVDYPSQDSHLETVPDISINDFKWEKNSILGVGNQGKVYEGEWQDRKVAVKIILIDDSNESYVKREIEIMKSIQHENFIRLLATCKYKKKMYLLTEYFAGESLHDIIHDEDLNSEYDLDENKKRKICIQICSAVLLLHERKKPIIHRDLKPENMLLDKTNHIKLCDFGVSTYAMTTTIGAAKGTYMYMAPEIFLNKGAPSIESDVWSLAVTICELILQNYVWCVKTKEELEEKFRSEETPNLTGVPADLLSILQLCLSYKKEQRPTVREVLNAFQ